MVAGVVVKPIGQEEAVVLPPVFLKEGLQKFLGLRG
jgi:hypothetical protein